MKVSSERKKNKTIKSQYNYSYLGTSPEEGVVSVCFRINIYLQVILANVVSSC